MNHPRAFVRAGCAALGLIIPAVLSGAGFALIEQSFSGLGNGFAGGAAVAEDASTIFYNPAGLTRLSGPQAVGGLHYIMPKAEFANQGSLSAGKFPTTGQNANGGENAPLPNFYYAHPFGDKMVLGFGMTAPFGLTTDYPQGWVGRYVAIKSALKTINLNPTIAYRLNEKWSVALGFSVQYIDAELSSAIDFGTIAAQIAGGVNQKAGATLIPPTQFLPQAHDGALVMTGDDFGYGFNAGVLYEMDESTRFGLHYRSSIEHTLDGDADFTVPATVAGYVIPVLNAPLLAAGGLAFPDQPAQAGLDLPETISASFFKALGNQWEVMGDVTWTRWSRFDYLILDYTNAQTPNSVIPEMWHDVFRYSVGANYLLDSAWKLRGGLVFDQSPVFENQYRSPRIPDEDRIWIALGVSYTPSEHLTFHAGYVHIFVDDPQIDNPTHTAGQYLKGTFDASVDILSVGGSYSF